MNEIDFLRLKLSEVAHLAFVDVRNLARNGAGALEQIRDLADTAELIPDLLVTWDDTRYGLVRSGLAEYARKYGWPGQRLLAALHLDPAADAQRRTPPDAEQWLAEPVETAD
jgi:hypothetical protein